MSPNFSEHLNQKRIQIQEAILAEQNRKKFDPMLEVAIDESFAKLQEALKTMMVDAEFQNIYGMAEFKISDNAQDKSRTEIQKTATVFTPEASFLDQDDRPFLEIILKGETLEDALVYTSFASERFQDEEQFEIDDVENVSTWVFDHFINYSSHSFNLPSF